MYLLGKLSIDIQSILFMSSKKLWDLKYKGFQEIEKKEKRKECEGPENELGDLNIDIETCMYNP